MTDGRLRVTVVGCSGTYPEAGGSCSSYLVRHRGTTVLLDAGPGTLSRLQEVIDLEDLDVLVLSHAHPDHWLDVPVLRNVLRYVLERPGLRVLAPAELGGYADVLFEERHQTFDWHDVADGDHVTVAGIELSFSRTDHPPETLAVRLEADGTALAYTADTGPGWSVAAFGAPVDLALWEATFVGSAPEGAHHTTAGQAGGLAADAGVGRLVLTHLLPGTDAARSRREASERFGGVVEVARPGATYTV